MLFQFTVWNGHIRGHISKNCALSFIMPCAFRKARLRLERGVGEGAASLIPMVVLSSKKKKQTCKMLF